MVWRRDVVSTYGPQAWTEASPAGVSARNDVGGGGASSHGQLARRNVKGERYDEGEK